MNYLGLVKKSGIVIVGFILLLVGYFPTVFMDGEVLPRHDIEQSIYSQKETTDFRNKTGEEPIWTGRMFSGMPMYLNSVAFDDYVTHFQTELRFLPSPVDVFLLMYISFLVLLVSLRVNLWFAAALSAIFCFNSFMIFSVQAGHVWKVLAMAYVPLTLAGIVYLFRRKFILGSTIYLIGVALLLGSQHYQIVYYSVFFIGIFTVIELYNLLKKKELSNLKFIVLILILGGGMGLLPSTARLWTTLEYTPFSTRGGTELTAGAEFDGEVEKSKGLTKDYAFAWSQGKWETFTLLIPNLYGGGSTTKLDENSELFKAFSKREPRRAALKRVNGGMNTYWGDQPGTGGPIYAGVVSFYLFVLGFLILEKKQWLGFVLAGAFLLVISWGKNLELVNYFFFDNLPMFNKFRTVAMALYFPIIVMLVLAGRALNKVFDMDRSELLPKAFKAFYISGGIVLGIYLLTIMFGDFFVEREKGYDPWIMEAFISQRKSMLGKDTFRSIFFITATFGLIYLFTKEKKQWVLLLIGITTIGILDVSLFDKRYLNNDNFEAPKTADLVLSKSPADVFILNDNKEGARVFNLNNPFNEANTSYFHRSIGGYSGLKMRRYQDLIERQVSKNNPKVLDMLNVKYIIKDPKQQPYVMPTNLGNAWFVGSVKKVSNPDEEMAALNNDEKNQFKPNEYAVVNVNQFKVSSSDFSANGTIELLEYKPNSLSYTSKNEGRSLAVFSEIYYPKGWDAFIDGEKVAHIRVNYVLRALEIPAGEHKVEFKFAPESYAKGNIITKYGSILVLCLFVGGLVYGIKKEAEVETEEG